MDRYFRAAHAHDSDIFYQCIDRDFKWDGESFYLYKTLDGYLWLGQLIETDAYRKVHRLSERDYPAKMLVPYYGPIARTPPVSTLNNAMRARLLRAIMRAQDEAEAA